MSTLGLHIGELQRVTAQLEGDLDECVHYELDQRESIALALRDVVARLEIARISVIVDSEDGPHEGVVKKILAALTARRDGEAAPERTGAAG